MMDSELESGKRMFLLDLFWIGKLEDGRYSVVRHGLTMDL